PGQTLELDDSVAHRGKFRLLQPKSPGNRIAARNCQLCCLLRRVYSNWPGAQPTHLGAFGADFDVPRLSDFRNIPDWICACVEWRESYRFSRSRCSVLRPLGRRVFDLALASEHIRTSGGSMPYSTG